MKISPSSSETAGDVLGESHCLVQSVAQAFAQEPGLEAVRINHADRSVSVATFGKGVCGDIEQTVSTRIRELQQNPDSVRCALLEGATDCATCPTPFPSAIGRNLTIQREGMATTIARVTCPTAPKFWRWHLL